MRALQVFAKCYSSDGRHYWDEIQLTGDESIFAIGKKIMITAGEYEDNWFRVADVEKNGDKVHIKLFEALPSQ
jgi:hypothetical protein